MGTRQRLVRIGQRVVTLVAMVLLVLGTFSCARPTEPTQLMEEPTVQSNRLTSKLAEVSPPETIQTLKQVIDAYTPQVRILSPRPGEIVEDTAVSLRVQVRGLPLFKDETFGLGPHLHVFLDNEPYKAVYDLSKPLEFKDLAPGTHTLRVFASRPWHESFKNQGAFDQRTFHIYAPTPQDELSAEKPVLTYSRPQGSYGAEPIMLDFYLTNAPLHMTAQEDPKDDIHDWRIRCTVNGQSFVFDAWQAVYLKGFEPGRNWVQLELIDEAGNPIDNRFNNTIRVIDYQPGGDDTLSKLVRGELDVKEVAGIIDPTYEPPAKPELEPEPAPEPEEVAPEPEEVAPEVEEGMPEAKEGMPEAKEARPSVEEPLPQGDRVSPAEDKKAAEFEPTAPAEEAPATRIDKSVPAEPKVPAAVVPPVAPESTVPRAEEPSDLVPEVTPEELQEKTTREEAEVEASEEPDKIPGVEPAVPPVETTSPELDSAVDRQLLESVPSSGSEGQDQDVLGEEEQTATTPERRETPETENLPPDEIEGQSESAKTSAGNKLLERYQQWQRRRQPNQPKPEQSAPAPDADRVDVYLSPEPESNPEPSNTQDSDSSDGRMDLPDLVEPYLTEPYLTEPRLDIQSPEENNENSGSITEEEKSQNPESSKYQPGKKTVPSGEKPFI